MWNFWLYFMSCLTVIEIQQPCRLEISIHWVWTMHSDIRSFQCLLYIINCVIWHFHIRYSHNLYIGGRIVFFRWFRFSYCYLQCQEIHFVSQLFLQLSAWINCCIIKSLIQVNLAKFECPWLFFWNANGRSLKEETG